MDLFTGIAVIIDDEIEDDKANINNLIKQIDKKRMPYIVYKELPEDEIINNLGGISFLLLDWLLQSKDIMDAKELGVSIPPAVKQSHVDANIEFLKKIKDKYFFPVFIFTNEDKNTVISALQDNGLYIDGKPNSIFVKNKSELNGRKKLFTEIEKWAQNTLSIYVLKEWEKEYNNAKSQLFHDFHTFGPSWPKILWDNYKDDGANPSIELGDLITQNIHTRMAPFSFDDTILGKRGPKVQNDEVLKVLEGERFIKVDKLHEEDIATGDLFYGKKNENGNGNEWYWLNVRAQCDLVRESNPKLYCLKGRPLQKSKNGVHFIDGQFIEKVNHAIIGCINDGNIVEFLFKDLHIVKWNSMKEKRIGRLLPPYITSIQQRYGLYLQRQGLPRIPEIVVRGN